MWGGGGAHCDMYTISQYGPTSVMGGADNLTTLPFVVVQQRVITRVVSKNNDFKVTIMIFLIIGAKTSFT